MKENNAFQKIRTERTRVLINAVKSYVISNGIHGNMMSEIASLAKISRTTLYKYYENIDELLFAAATDVMKNLQNFININKIEGTQERIWEIAENFYKFYKSYPDDILYISLFDAYNRTRDRLSILNLGYEQFFDEDSLAVSNIKEIYNRGDISNQIGVDMILSLLTNTVIGVVQRMAILGDKLNIALPVENDNLFAEVIRMLKAYLQPKSN